MTAWQREALILRLRWRKFATAAGIVLLTVGVLTWHSLARLCREHGVRGTCPVCNACARGLL